MQLEVRPYDLPSALTFNYEELKAALTEKCREYEMMIYSDDQIRQAKQDRADLNRLKKALTDERIRREKEYMEPFNDFKAKVNEIIGIIDKPAAIIDQRVKEFDEQKKQEKQNEIGKIFIECELPEHVTLEKIFDPKWLNTTVSLNQIRDAILAKKKHDEENIEMLSGLPEYSFEALEIYKSRLDVAEALTSANKMAAMAKKKKEAEEAAAKQEEIRKLNESAKKATEIINVAERAAAAEDPEPEPVRSWIRFEALLSYQEAIDLNAYFKFNNIKFQAIREEN